LAASVGAVLEADQRGCQLDRKMDDLIRAAGFQINSIKTCHMAEALDIVRAVYRDLHDDHAPPRMDRYSNAGKPPGAQARKMFVFDSIVVVRNELEFARPARARRLG
jgi:hypothetical protein